MKVYCDSQALLVWHTNLDNLQLVTSAILLGDIAVLRRYIQNGESPDADYGTTLLAQAVSKGSVDMVTILLDGGANVNFGGKSGKFPLYMAARNQNASLGILQLLIQRGADLNLKYLNGNTALLESVWANDIEKASVLIAAGANVLDENNQGDTALHISALKGSVDMTKLLIKAGIPAGVTNYCGRKVERQTGTQPLHLTTFGPSGGFADVARVLLEAGADVNAAELNGATALHHAAIRDAYKVLDVLLEYNCDLNPVRDATKTPVMKAIDAGHSRIVSKLILAGASLDMTDIWGTSPLLAAVFAGYPHVVKILIQSGCDVDQSIPGDRNVTPLSASLHKSLSITVMLVAAGCRIFGAMDLTVLNQATTERVRWLRDVASQPYSLQTIACAVIRKRLGHFYCRPMRRNEPEKVDDKPPKCCTKSIVNSKLEALFQAGIPRRICDFIRCSELDEILESFEPSPE